MNRRRFLFGAFAAILVACVAGIASQSSGVAAGANLEAERSTACAPQANAVADVTVRPAADGADQAETIQQALHSLRKGQRLVFAPGRYVVGRSLVVKRAQVVISGYGATLVATNPDDQTIVMQGNDSTLVGLTLIGTGARRLGTPSSTKVDVTVSGVQVLDVTIVGGASAGIFVFGGKNVAIVGNRVKATLADGIHMTHGARNVLVQGNTVTGTGDDMIAVVSYKGDGVLSANALITNNSLEGNDWGRGISVVGGADVTIAGNTLKGVQKAAGILVAQEDSYRTYDVTNVLVASNEISDIENPAAGNDNLRPAEQAAIDLNAGSGTVTRMLVTGNRISGSEYAGVRTLGNVCRFHVSGNSLRSIAGTPISMESRGCAPGDMVIGDSNTKDGAALLPPAGSSATAIHDVTGADATVLPKVRNSLRQPQQALPARANGRRAAPVCNR
jgi:hypothetical protein